MLAAMLPAQRAAESNGVIHRDFFRWLGNLLRQSNRNTIPIGVVVGASLSAADVALYFDSTGLGVSGDRFDGWAICNGSNGTPDLDDKFPRFNEDEAGGTGGSDSSAHTHGSAGSANGSLKARIHLGTTSEKILVDETSSASWTADTEVDLGMIGGDIATSTDSTTAAVIVQGETSSASSTDNRPAYYELVPVMRIAA